MDTTSSKNMFFPDLRDKYPYTYIRINLDRTKTSEKIWRHLDPGTVEHVLPGDANVPSHWQPGAEPTRQTLAGANEPPVMVLPVEPKTTADLLERYHEHNVSSTGSRQEQRRIAAAKHEGSANASRSVSRASSYTEFAPPRNLATAVGSTRPVQQETDESALPKWMVDDDEPVPSKHSYGRVLGYQGFIPGLAEPSLTMGANVWSDMEFKKRQKAKLHPSTRKKVEMRGNLF